MVGRRILLLLACSVAVLSAVPSASAMGFLEKTGRDIVGDETWDAALGCSAADVTFTITPNGAQVDPEIRPECLDD